MSYLVLARKYRPATFDDVVEQTHVTQTLKNAVVSSRVAHAILFSGPRGTGKTTIARILAKAMNCYSGPTPTPCNECRSCIEISQGNAVDVLEIDGASNNGVEQIRELKENVRYIPSHSRFKIYIIDEVHMLTNAAFNALLKTLEEPPPHIMFLLATTEPQKIPITILSRCQRHDLRRINLEQITSHMKRLCDHENIRLHEETLWIIARESGGSMRDALSLLDQIMVCATSDGIQHEDVLHILGVINRKVIFELSSALISGDIPEILTIIDDLYSKGYPAKKVCGDLIEHFRNLLLVKINRSSSETNRQKFDRLVDVLSHELEQMNLQVQNVNPLFLNQIFEILFREETTISYSSQPKLALEMACIKVASLKPVLSMDDLISKIDLLRTSIETKSDITDMWYIGQNQRQKQPIRQQTVQQVQQVQQQQFTGAGAGLVPNSTVQQKGEQIGSPLQRQTVQQPFQQKPKPLQSQANLTPPLTVEPSDDAESSWKKIMIRLKELYPSLGGPLLKSILKIKDDNSLDIQIEENEIFVNFINQKKQEIQNVCSQFFQKNMSVNIVPVKSKSDVSPTNEKKKLIEEQQALKQEAINHPLVAEAIKIFGGRLVDVKILSSTTPT